MPCDRREYCKAVTGRIVLIPYILEIENRMKNRTANRLATKLGNENPYRSAPIISCRLVNKIPSSIINKRAFRIALFVIIYEYRINHGMSLTHLSSTKYKGWYIVIQIIEMSN